MEKVTVNGHSFLMSLYCVKSVKDRLEYLLSCISAGEQNSTLLLALYHVRLLVSFFEYLDFVYQVSAGYSKEELDKFAFCFDFGDAMDAEKWMGKARVDYKSVNKKSTSPAEVK